MDSTGTKVKTILAGLTAAVMLHHVYALWRLKRTTNLPVNYWTLPIVGEVQYVLDFAGSQKRQLAMHKRLGPVFASFLFGRVTVFVGSTEMSDLVHYSKKNKDALGIEYIESIKSILSDEAMAMMNAGPEHDEQRQIIMTLIGQKSLPPLFPTISKEFHGAIAHAAGGGGKERGWQNVFEILKDSIWNVMYRVTMGGNSDHNAEEMKELFVDFGTGLFSMPIQQKYRAAKRASERLFAMVKQEFATREPNFDVPATDLIQAHVNHAAKFNVQPNMKGRVIDIYGSLDTTKSFATVMFELMVERPALLEKIYLEEVFPAFNSQGLLHPSASFDLIGKMPLVCAVVAEVLRFGNITPLIMRVANRDIDLGHGATIPENAFIVTSIFSVIHTNPCSVNPLEFEPERFLSPRLEREKDPYKSGGGKGCFGFGHRTCPGQQLAIAELRAFLVEMSYYVWEMQAKPEYLWNPVPSCPNGFMVRGRRRDELNTP